MTFSLFFMCINFSIFIPIFRWLIINSYIKCSQVCFLNFNFFQFLWMKQYFLIKIWNERKSKVQKNSCGNYGRDWMLGPVMENWRNFVDWLKESSSWKPYKFKIFSNPLNSNDCETLQIHKNIQNHLNSTKDLKNYNKPPQILLKPYRFN